MPQPCKICRHTDHQAIDAALLEGFPALRAIGEQYGVSKDSLSRHFHAHVSDDGDQDEARQANTGAADSVLKRGKTIKLDEPRSATEPTDTVPILNNQNQSNEPAADPLDVETHYSAFLDRWRGQFWITRDQMRAWEFDSEELEGLLDEAIRRGDLWNVGQFYGASSNTLARFAGWRA